MDRPPPRLQLCLPSPLQLPGSAAALGGAGGHPPRGSGKRWRRLPAAAGCAGSQRQQHQQPNCGSARGHSGVCCKAAGACMLQLVSWPLLARLALHLALLCIGRTCTEFRGVQFNLLPGCCRGWPRARCTACRPPRARHRRCRAQLQARRMPAQRCHGSPALQTPPMATRECRQATSSCSPRGPHCNSSSTSSSCSSSSAWLCSSGAPAAQQRRRVRRPPRAAAASVAGQLQQRTPGRH